MSDWLRDYEASVESCKAAQKPQAELQLPTQERRLVEACHKGMLFLDERIRNDGWTGSLNYLREHVRCAYKESFTNTKSPKIYRWLLQLHPEWGKYLHIVGNNVEWR